MHCDAKHHAVAVKLLESLGLQSAPATDAEDMASIADIFIINGEERIPVGMKQRGENSGKDYNLSAWSMACGDLPEFTDAGDKAYLYWMLDKHILVKFPPQEELNALLPKKWTPITDGSRWKWTGQYSGVRKSSPYGSVTQQGVVYVPKHMVDVVAEWDLSLNRI